MEGARGREAGRGGVGRGLGAKGVHLCMFASSVLCVCVMCIVCVCVCVSCVCSDMHILRRSSAKDSHLLVCTPVCVCLCLCV